MKLSHLLIGLATATETCYGPLDPECREINCFEEYDWASVNCIKTCNFCVLSNPDSQEDAPIFLGANHQPSNALTEALQNLIINIRPPLNNRKKLNLSRRVKGRVELKFTRFSAFINTQVDNGNCKEMPKLQGLSEQVAHNESCRRFLNVG